MNFIALVCLASVLASGQVSRPDLNAGRLRTGSFLYRTLVDRAEAGRALIRVRRCDDSGNYVFSNIITGSFSQSWEAVASLTFSPVSAKLSFGEGAAARTAFEISYDGNRVTGFVIPRREPSRKREVDETIAGDTVDQRIGLGRCHGAEGICRGAGIPVPCL
jgi:hypothetical protein